MRTVVGVSLMFWIVALSACAAEGPTFPPPPRLATTAEALAKIKAAADFEKAKAQAAASADKLLAAPPPIPDGYGSWYFYYACPDDGTNLQPLNPKEHKCPKCGKVYADERTVASYRCLLHYDLEQAAQTLGWAYAYTGDDKYAAGVRRILVALADAYATYPDRLDRWGHKGILAPLGGRRYVQSLDEAVGVIRLAKGYDLTRASAAWADADRQHVEKDFFRATADSLLRFNQDINNHQTWYNAGLMAVASVLADKELVEQVLTMKGGYFDQLQRSVGRDGLWYEGTMAYHSYALQAMEEIVQAGRRMGLPLHQHPKFRAMFEGPIHAAYPNGQYPAVNDSDLMNIAAFQGHFRWAWEVYKDPLFAQAYAQGNADALHELLGPDAQVTWPLATGSIVLADAGLAKLQVGTGADAACVFMDYGPHGGGHGHYDKLNIMLYAQGREWLLDPGRLTYSHKEYQTWVKQTCAHNTVTLGGRSQQETAGKLLWFEAKESYAACAAESTGAYAGATLRRHLFLTPQVLVDIFEVEAREETQMDWFAHAASGRVEPVGNPGEAKEESPGDGHGYQHLTGGRAWTVQGDTTWDFVAGDKRLRLGLIGGGPEKLFAATGIGYNVEQAVPCLVRRRRAAQTRFIAAYYLNGQVGGMKFEKAAGERPDRIVLETADGNLEIALTPEGVKHTLTAGPAK